MTKRTDREIPLAQLHTWLDIAENLYALAKQAPNPGDPNYAEERGRELLDSLTNAIGTPPRRPDLATAADVSSLRGPILDVLGNMTALHSRLDFALSRATFPQAPALRFYGPRDEAWTIILKPGLDGFYWKAHCGAIKQDAGIPAPTPFAALVLGLIWVADKTQAFAKEG